MDVKRTSSKESLVGRRYERLVVLRLNRISNGRWWDCLCDCGNETTVATRNLNYGSSRSCGCLQRDTVASRRKHGLCFSSEYRCWARILQKCNNQRVKEYKNYGGRGIKVCDRWLKFENFLSDMGRKPALSRSIDRRNNDGDYEPGNCRWATRHQQDRNTRRNIIVTAFGRTQCVHDWAREAGIKSDTIVYRLRRGMSPEKAVASIRYSHGEVASC